jgi:hypothetical protein
MRIKLNCLACGHSMELGDAYEDYDGEVRCWVCHATLEVTLREGQLRSMKRSTGSSLPRPAAAVPSGASPPTLEPATSAADQETR